mgnify:FL=1
MVFYSSGSDKHLTNWVAQKIGSEGLRKVIFLFIFGVVAVVGYLIYYFNQYHIANDREAIQLSIMEWMNHDSESIEIIVKEIVQLDDTSSYIVLFQTKNGNVGYAHLIKGWNGKFIIVSSGGYGTNIVSYEMIKTNDGNYGILFGKNHELIVEHIKVELYYENYDYIVDVSTDELFVEYKLLPAEIKNPFPAELTYFDKEQLMIELSHILISAKES